MRHRTHTSSWRGFLAHAPVISAVIIVGVFFQGDPDILGVRNVYLVLAPVSLVGWGMAWWLGRLLSETPVTPVSKAQAGYVALRGKAQAMPNQPPLTTPSGARCVWYYYRPGSKFSSAIDSVQPFLLVDGSGQCVVLPAGAAITASHGSGTSEKRIAPGDPIYVAGEFRPLSSDTLQQIRDVEPDQSTTVSVSVSTKDMDKPDKWTSGEQLMKEAKAARAAASNARAEINRSAPLALPVICAPKHHGPLVINASKDGSNDGSWYLLLAKVNLVLLLGSGAMVCYLIWSGR